MAHLGRLTFRLGTALTALLGPREVSNRDNEEAVAGIRNTGQGIVPREEGSQQSKEATRLHDRGVGSSTVMPEVADSQQQEGQIQREEKREERHGGLQGAQQEHEGENKPALESS